MATPVDFRKYLQFLVEYYKKQQDIYTLTDLQVEVEVEIPPEDSSQPRSPENKPETKIERLEVLAGLRKYVQQGNVLLVGKPGSGKSTVLQRFRWELTREALKDRDRQIPVLVKLWSDRSIVQAICAEFRQAKVRVSSEDVDDLLRDGKLLLLLDGLDEMPSQQRLQELQQFCDDNPDTPMIFTTRDLALGGLLGIEKKLEMCAALTQAQIREFVGKYLPQHGDLLLRQLRDRLPEVAETPLLLKMMCEVFENTGEIPQSKGELFQKLDRQYDEFKGDASVSEDFRRFKSDLLQQLAFVMFQGDSQQPTEGWVAISRDRAEGILEGWLGDRGVLDAPTKAKEWLEDLLEHHLLQVAAKPEEIEFHHQLFQEYYAGRALLKLFDDKHPDAMDDERLQHFYLNYFKWTEPLAFMLSLLEHEVQAVRVVRLALDVDLRLGARLAGEVQREFQKRTVGLVDELDVPGWLKVELLGETRSDDAIPGLLKLVEDSDSDVRSKAANALGEIGSEVAIPGLLKLVKDSDSDVRSKATNALGKIGSEVAIPGLLKLVEDSDSDVRRSAADTLGKIGSDDVIPGLLRLVKDPDSDVRSKAANALGKIGSVAAIPGLLKLVKYSDSDVRCSATDALGKIGSVAAIPGLLKLVEDSDSDVRRSAADTLGKIGSDDAIPGLLKLVEHSQSDVRKNAADALGKIGSEAAIPGLLKFVNDSDSNVSKNAADALGKIGSWAAIPGLLKLLENSNSNVSKNAAEALGKIGSTEAIPGLLKLVENSDYDVRKNAAYALGKIVSEVAIPLAEDSDSIVPSMSVDALDKIGSEAAIPELLKLVEHSDSSVRRNAAYALGEIAKQHTEEVTAHLPHLLTLIPSKSGKEVYHLILAIQAACKYYNYTIAHLPLLPAYQQIVLDTFGTALEDASPAVRAKAAEALGKIGDISIAPILVKTLKDTSPEVRRSAIQALGQLKDEASIPHLLAAGQDSDNLVRQSVAEALGNIGSYAAISALLKLVEDSNYDVRKSAADALGKIGSEAAIPALLKLVEDANSDVRKSAIDALGKIGSEAAISVLLKLVEDPDAEIRQVSAIALGKLGNENIIPVLIRLLEDSNAHVRESAVDALGSVAQYRVA